MLTLKNLISSHITRASGQWSKLPVGRWRATKGAFLYILPMNFGTGPKLLNGRKYYLLKKSKEGQRLFFSEMSCTMAHVQTCALRCQVGMQAELF